MACFHLEQWVCYSGLMEMEMTLSLHQMEVHSLPRLLWILLLFPFYFCYYLVNTLDFASWDQRGDWINVSMNMAHTSSLLPFPVSESDLTLAADHDPVSSRT